MREVPGRFTWLLRLARRIPLHVWIASASNPWTTVEERCCLCGAYRHHLFEDAFPGPGVRWRAGEHPMAKDLRAEEGARTEACAD